MVRIIRRESLRDWHVEMTRGETDAPRAFSVLTCSRVACRRRIYFVFIHASSPFRLHTILPTSFEA